MFYIASWAGLSPGNHESAGKRKNTRTVKGNPHIKSASRSPNTRLSVKYWSLAARRGKKKALVAIGH
jgi:transposase